MKKFAPVLLMGFSVRPPALRIALLLLLCGLIALPSSAEDAKTLSLDTFGKFFAHEYEYILRETEGEARKNEPVEITLTMPGNPPDTWREHVRVLRVKNKNQGILVPHQIMGEVQAGSPDTQQPFPATSINVIFLADCAAGKQVTYRLFWGLPEGGKTVELPSASVDDGLKITGDAPGLTIENDFYHIKLSPTSGAIQRIHTNFQTSDTEMFYRTLPVHFGVDIWSPGQAWDHDYDWPLPPNQKVEGGPLALRYQRWGPLQTYQDVEVSITYTFYAHNPYVQVSSTMRLTKDRSAHAIRMGEIVVSHSRKPSTDSEGVDEKNPEIFTHYGWPNGKGGIVKRIINTHRNAKGEAVVEGQVTGTLGVLDRDVPWVAGYNADEDFGIATLRKHQFAGNYLGGVTPQSAPCTYLGQYGWGFIYWSRPMVYPMGEAKSPLDLNTAVAAGTLFATEEALLLFKPDRSLSEVRSRSLQFTKPLRFEFKGTGPW